MLHSKPLRRSIWIPTLTLAIALAAASASAVPIAPGYTVESIDPGGDPYGDVVLVDGHLFVGVGSFGATEIVRIAPDDTTTVIATGFSSLAGFTYDPVNDRLIVGDNAAGATTGDTLYSIPDPVGHAGSPIDAETVELLPAGSTPGIADLVMDPNDPTGETLFLTDATEAFPPVLGAVYELDLATSTLSSLVGVGTNWFAAGLAASADTLFAGDSQFPPAGRVRTIALPVGGTPDVDFLATTLPGQYDLEIDADGFLLSSSNTELLRIDPVDGSASAIATGFTFAGGVGTGPDGEIYVIDSGFPSALFRLTPIPEPTSAALVGLALAAVALRRRA